MMSNQNTPLVANIQKYGFMIGPMPVTQFANHASPPTEPFGARLARLRRMAGYTQRSLADEIGISYRVIAYYEGETEHAPAHLLPLFARALGVTVEQLLGVTAVSSRRKPENQRLMRTLRKVERLSSRARRAVVDHIDALWAKEHATMHHEKHVAGKG
jgi:transcriptional regulator with XRE-family HTH domain